MSTNKDILKQAIAEAKTIREAAIANAKEALEESLTPHLKEMLAQKLQEMENDEMEEEISEETINGAETQSYSENPRRHGNVLREEEDEEAPEEDEKEPTEEEEPTEDEGEEEDIKIEDMSVEELKDLIRDIVAQETGAEDETGDDLGAEDMTGMEDGEEIDINELLAELAQEGTVTEGFDEWLERVSAQMEKFGKENPAIQAIEKAISTAQEKAKKAGLTGHGMSKGHRISEAENLEEGFEEWLERTSAQMEKFGKENPAIQAIEKAVTAAQEKFKKAGLNSPLGGSKAFQESAELNEALKTVQILRSQLQEVNLLNAKLLYVNKVFKANNLTEGQKVNVVAAFDKAETVKEVKLVFETVSKNVVAKQPVRLSLIHI